MFMYIISIYFLKNYAGMHSCQLDLLGALFLRIPFSVLFQVKAEQRRTSGGLSDAVVDKRRGTRQVSLVLAQLSSSPVLLSCPSVLLATHGPRLTTHRVTMKYTTKAFPSCTMSLKNQILQRLSLGLQSV